MSRRTTLAAAALAALLTLPAAAGAQDPLYEATYTSHLSDVTGTATVGIYTPVSTTGCGTYLCATIAAGRLADADRFGAFFAVERVTLTDAGRALVGGGSWMWTVAARLDYALCWEGGCDQDGFGGLNFPYFIGNAEVTEPWDLGREESSVYAQGGFGPTEFWGSVRLGEVAFHLTDDEGALLLTEAIAPRVLLDGQLLAPVSTVPEPGTWALLGTGLVALGAVAPGARRRRTA